MTENSCSHVLVGGFPGLERRTYVVVSACAGFNSSLSIVLTLVGEIVVCWTGTVVSIVKAVGERSTYCGETVSPLVTVEVFTSASLGLCFVRSFKGNS